jgi:hypothetical protein
MNVELVRYDAACRALAEAVDEVMLIRDEAAAIAACARIANNHQAEADAVALRMRATRRLGQLMQAQKETVGVNRGAAGGGAMTLRSSSELADDEGRVFVAYAPPRTLMVMGCRDPRNDDLCVSRYAWKPPEVPSPGADAPFERITGPQAERLLDAVERWVAEGRRDDDRPQA